MTDEQRKQIENRAKICSDMHLYSKEVSKPLEDTYKSCFIHGAEFGLSLAESRVKELENMLEAIAGWLMREKRNGRLSVSGNLFLEKIEQLLAPTYNEEQKG